MNDVTKLMETANKLERDQKWAEAITAWREVADHPCAWHVAYLPEVWSEIAETHRRLGQHDAAIEAWRQAITLGYGSNPLPECNIAELLLESGHREQADDLYAWVKEQTPDDEYLYNNAGFAYNDAGDYATALEWLSTGISIAMAAGDPERLVVHMAERRDHCLRELGTDPVTDAFSAEVAQFLADWVKPTRSYFDRFPSEIEYEDPNRECEHCGYTEAALDDVLLQTQLAGVSPALGEWPGATASSWPTMPPDVAQPPSPHSKAVLTALAWFPSDQWAQALTRWPALAENNASKHSVYCQELDAHLWRLQDAAPPASHMSLAVAPIRIEHYLDWCENEGEDPAARATRASYAANQARLGDTIAWPPAGRQHPCWCGSGRKYKRCCAPRD